MRYTEQYCEDLLSVKDCTVNVEALRNSSVLVTGAGGLICSAVVDFLMLLNEKYQMNIKVYAAGRNEERIRKRFSKWTENSRFFYLPFDATQPFEAEASFDYMIHGASNANPSLYMKEPVETMLANFQGMKTLLDYARDHNARRILYISSSEVYGKKESVDAFREDNYGFVNLLDPRSCYPSSKRAAETLCAAYMQEYGVQFVIARPGHVYGPTMTSGDTRASSQFPRDVLENHDIIMKSEGKQMRSYCYVADCVSAILSILLAGTPGEAYNISNRDSVVTIREMAEAFAVCGGKKVVFDLPSEQEKRGFNAMDNSSLYADKLEKLGWKAKFTMQQGAAATLASAELQ